MKIKIRKLFVDFEKEEAWINEVAAKGLNLVDYCFGRYLFEEGSPGEYTYRMELLPNLPTHPESIAYIKFMEETGVECVATYMRWVYFRKKKTDGPFDIYSDSNSRIKHYKRITALLTVVIGLNLFSAISNLTIGLSNGLKRGFYFNAYISIISWLAVIIFTPLVIKYLRKIYKIRKDMKIYE